VEIPMGTPLREVIYDIGGGIPNKRKFKAVQTGGPSGGCIPAEHLDVGIDYENLKELGAIVGSGGMVVMDEDTCMVDIARYFLSFTAEESCGQCTPCRVGLRRMLEILEAITRQRRKEDGLDALLRFQGIMYLKHLGETIKATSLCGLGQTAPNPVLSTLKWFRDEYEAHIFERRCPAGACRELVGAPCQNTCPVGTEVWRYVAHVARGEYNDAYRVIRQANPFPSACARVCHHPCETMCRAGATGGEAIAVRTLKRFVVDQVDPATYTDDIKPAKEGAPKVAVIGAGPSGLTAAHYLGAMGYRVTILEKECAPGGMLVQAIPEYRLPRGPLEREIKTLLNRNVELVCEKALGKDFTIESLLNEDGYRAVYVAIGSHRSRKLDVPGEDEAKEGVIPGIQFLKAHNLRGEHLARGRVGVVGGGNSAMDAARVALRQPGVERVTIFYRRTGDEMPAYAEEMEAGLAEGIRLETLAAPVEVISENGRIKGVRFIRNELGEPDASGRARPVPVPGSEFAVELDTLIVAIGEQPDLGDVDGLKTTRGGTVAVDGESYATNRSGVFAGGDAVTGPNTVIDAVAAGKNAAAMIDNYLRGRLLRALGRVKLPSVYIEPLETKEEEAEAAARVEVPHLGVPERAKTFAEVELCISEGAARSEAKRCLRCDLDFTQPV